MNLEPMIGGNDGKVSWHFEVIDNRLQFQINVSGSVSTEFAERVLENAIARQQQAIIAGDAISLDFLIAGLRKEAINDLDSILKKASA